MRSHHQDAKTVCLRRGSVALLIRGPSFCHALNFSFCKYMYLYYRLLPFSYAFVMTLTQGHIKVKVTVDTCLKYGIAWIMTAIILYQLHFSFHDSRITIIIVIFTLLHSCSDSEKIAEVIHVPYWFQQISKEHDSCVMIMFTKSQILTMVRRTNTLTDRMTPGHIKANVTMDTCVKNMTLPELGLQFFYETYWINFTFRSMTLPE